jgi:hypothetical protein
MKLYSLLYSNGLCGIFDSEKIVEEIKLKFNNVKFVAFEIEGNVDLNIGLRLYIVPVKDTGYPIFISSVEAVAIDKLKELELIGIADDMTTATLNKINPLVLEVLEELQKLN